MNTNLCSVISLVLSNSNQSYIKYESDHQMQLKILKIEQWIQMNRLKKYNLLLL